MITFFHTADIHFGVENYGKIDPDTGIHSRLLDFKKSLDTCIDQAIAENIDFFLFSGDAYKTAHPTPTQQKLLMHSLFRLQQAGIPIIIIVGNHDHPLSFGKAHALDVFAHLPLAGLHVFSKPEILRIITKNGPVQIVGIPWPTRHNVVVHDQHRYKSATEITTYISQRLGEIITSLAGELDPNEPAVLAGHLTVSNGIFSGSEKCAIYGTDPFLMPSQLAIEPFDYVALGHLHRYQNLNPNGHPAVVYSGSIDRVDFGERKEAKGFCKVQIAVENGQKSCSHEFVPLKTRPFVQIEVTIDPAHDQTEQVKEAIVQHEITDAIVKIIYKLPPGKKDCVDLNVISRMCAPAMAIASISAVHQPLAKEHRPALKISMDLDTLLTRYFEHRGISTELNDELRKKAHEIVQEVETVADDSSST